MKRSPALALSMLALLPALSCKSAALRDDIRFELTFSFVPTIRKPDVLHLPYVTGAKVNLWLEDDAGADMNGWRFDSSDPAVFSIETRETGIGTMRGVLRARAEGRSVVRAYDTLGRLRYTYDIPVVAPDRVELYSHGPLLLREPESAARVEEARILEGGKATFLVRYFRGNRRLHGNGALVAAASGGIAAEPRTTFLFENQEWISLSARSAGEHALDLAAGSSPAVRFRVVGVREQDLVRLELDGGDEGRARRGDWLNVVVTGVDRSGHTVLGVDCAWLLEGESQYGRGPGWPWEEEASDVGDLFRYEYRAGFPKMLVAERGGLQAQATIHAGLGYVSSTNKLGCSAAGDDTASLAGAVLILLAALLISRRQPRRGRDSEGDR
jgi:uncharacterized protein (TIGR03382 family)